MPKRKPGQPHKLTHKDHDPEWVIDLGARVSVQRAAEITGCDIAVLNRALRRGELKAKRDATRHRAVLMADAFLIRRLEIRRYEMVRDLFRRASEAAT